MNLMKLEEAIQEKLQTVSLKELSSSVQKLTKMYREGIFEPFSSDFDRLAYLAVRLPATTAVLARILEELPQVPITSVLDLGASVGASSWLFENLDEWLGIEQDEGLIQIGQNLYQDLPSHIQWERGDFIHPFESSKTYDLVLFSYSIGEVSDGTKTIKNYLKNIGQFLLIIEPGTPRGFERIRTYRSALIETGLHLIAPCPHHDKCPMEGGNWCHFSKRLSRSSLHRTLKEGSLGYEDEKFSYLLFSKKEFKPNGDRVLRVPLKRKGLVELELCTPTGIQKKRITKKQKENYKKAKNTHWGDVFV